MALGGSCWCCKEDSTKFTMKFGQRMNKLCIFKVLFIGVTKTNPMLSCSSYVYLRQESRGVVFDS